MSSPSRLQFASPWLAGIALLAITAAAAGLASNLSRLGERVDLQDFVEYWAAGRLNAHGSNPYDSTALYECERQVSPGLTDAIMMWNPPWALSLAMPFAALRAPIGHALWLWLQLMALAISAGALWQYCCGPGDRQWVAYLLAAAFAPTWFVVRMGQISPMILLGVVGFLVFERRGRDLAAGASLALASLKPHLVLVFMAALLLWVVEHRRWRVVLGAALGAGLLLVAPLASNPQVVAEYWHALGHRPPQMLSPTAGSLLRLAFGSERFWLQFLPAAAGLAWLLAHMRSHRRHWDWSRETPLLLLVSFVTASYGAWPFDLVVLLVPLVRRWAEAIQKRRWDVLQFALPALIGFDLAMWLFRNVHYSAYVWYVWATPALFGLYWILGRQLAAAPAAGGPSLSPVIVTGRS